LTLVRGNGATRGDRGAGVEQRVSGRLSSVVGQGRYAGVGRDLIARMAEADQAGSNALG